ncbi:hypothetical protein AQJ27_21625 [Streptomyces olivochromogenes]|uniref:IS1380 family transposase n=1 Tax=Streptomyces olivochromogenes TaxID=1963 RepID=A0A250VBS3_STROL|nr:hypothetical protein AQJ27_21625 [Streptomyces olivochromogenes]GAX51522.1 IS1380 family transposase [Streptomyces olivochromogenes]
MTVGVDHGRTGAGEPVAALPRPGDAGRRRLPASWGVEITDVDGNRITCSATNTQGSQLADLELRRRARCEDPIRNARDTGLRNLPLHGFTQDQI